MNKKSRGITKPERSRSRLSDETKLPQSTTIVYNCEICKIQSNSLFQLKDHLKGKRHKMAVYENLLTENREDRLEEVDDTAKLSMKMVSAIFIALGVSIVNYLYLFFKLIDIDHEVDLFYF